MRMGGRKLLNHYGRPAKGKDIQKHFEDWQILLNKYGSDLMQSPEECFYRALEVIPQELEDEIVMKPEIRTQWDVYQFVTRRTTHQKHLAQQRALLQSRSRRSPMPELSPKTNDMFIDDIVAKTVAAVQRQNPRKDDKSRGRSPGRSTQSGPTPGKFWFKHDCWWCGMDGHQKKDCEKYLKMLAGDGGSRQKGLKGAFDKAKDAWLKENRPRSKSVKSIKPLMSENIVDESDDDESDLAPLGSMVCTNIFGLRCIPCANDDGDAESTKEVVIENDEDIEAVLKAMCDTRESWT